MALQSGDEAEPVAFLWGLWAWAYLHGTINSRHTLLLCRFCTLGLPTSVQTLCEVGG